MRVSAEFIVIPMAGERVSGDTTVVRSEGDWTLLSVVDALGHGPKAAPVAEAAVRFLGSVPKTMDAGALMRGLDEALRGGRGAAAMICVLEAGRMVGCGVGNVECYAVGVKLPVALTPGVVGGRMHRLRVFEAAMPAGTRLVMYSDGMSSGILSSDVKKLGRAEACRALMDRHRKTHDDATVLVADVEAD